MFSPLRWLLGRFLQRHAQQQKKQFHALTQRPMEVQRDRLFEQIRREAPTAFGRDHGFKEIRTVAEFRRQVPITKYEYVAPYIERVKNGETEALFHKQPVLMFAMTSGTTDTRKFIPVTPRFLHDYRRGWTVWGLHLFESHKELWFKTMLQIVSNHDEFRTPAGIPCGSISGLTARMQRYVIRKTYCLPAESAQIAATQTKYYMAWRLGLVRNLGLILSANPSTMVALARFGDEHREKLIRDVYEGTVHPDFPIPDALRKVERHRLRPNRARAKELEEIVSRTGRLAPKDVWPTLKLLGNWTGGSVGAHLRHYPDHYGTPAVRDLGLIASEGRMTIPMEDGTSGGVLEIGSTFFEFIPAGEID
ncbi:MAG: GH3 family domain-containing protein, partial [Planctomycetia bacterium]